MKFFRPLLALVASIASRFTSKSPQPKESTSKNGDSLTGRALRDFMAMSIFDPSGRNGNIHIRIASRTTNQRKRRKNLRRLIAAGAC